MERTISLIRQLFSNCYNTSYPEMDSPRLSFDNGNTIMGYIDIPFSGDEFTLPLISFENTVTLIKSNCRQGMWLPTNIEVPIYMGGLPQTRRTADSIFRNAMIVSNGERIVEINTRDSKYYGGRGAIFDRNFNPLIMFGVKCHIKVDSHNQRKVGFLAPVCYIDPAVFLDQTNIVSKNIVKKILPAIYSTNVGSIFRPGEGDYQMAEVAVYIEHLGSIVNLPKAPSAGISSDTLNDVAIENIDEIMHNIYDEV